MRGQRKIVLAFSSAASEYDTTFGQIVRREFDSDLVACKDSDVIFAHAPRDVGRYDMTVFQFNAKHGVGQFFHNPAFHLNTVFFCHIR